MGLLSYTALFAFAALIALEGFSPDFQKNQIAQASALITLIGKHAEFDVKPILPHLVYLRYVAISAIGVVVFDFYGFFVALYLILTRGLTIFTIWNKIFPALAAGDFQKLASTHVTELTPFLTSVALIAFFLGSISLGSRKVRAPRAPKPEDARASKTEGESQNSRAGRK